MFKKLVHLNSRTFSTSSAFQNKVNVGLIGAPFSDGQPRKGTELGKFRY